MNKEISELDDILNHLETTSLEPHDDYTSEFTYKDQKILYKYIQDLKKQLEEGKNIRNKAIEMMKDQAK